MDVGENESPQPTVVEEETKELERTCNKNRRLFNLNSLPPGFRFNPSDGEMIVHYLKRRVHHQPLPPNKIIELDLYALDPENLPVRYEPYETGEWFCFTPRDRKYRKGQRANRSVGDIGNWKAAARDKEIRFEDTKVGYRSFLVFYRRTPAQKIKTSWRMYEFRLFELELPEPPRTTGANDMRLDDCVLCKVYRKGVQSSTESQQECVPAAAKSPLFDLNTTPNEAFD